VRPVAKPPSAAASAESIAAGAALPICPLGRPPAAASTAATTAETAAAAAQWLPSRLRLQLEQMLPGETRRFPKEFTALQRQAVHLACTELGFQSASSGEGSERFVTVRRPLPDGAEPVDELPNGITKELVKESDSSNWKKPKDGDDVFIHYVGTLESDGSEFDSSRSRGKEFSFVVGQGMVVKGASHYVANAGVMTMKKGELTKFTLASEYAYGEQGFPPTIPPNASLVFEIEIIRWMSKSDLFQDSGVTKSTVAPPVLAEATTTTSAVEGMRMEDMDAELHQAIMLSVQAAPPTSPRVTPSSFG